MAEYIEKSEAIKIVDGIDTFCSGWRDYAMKQIDNYPAANVRENVRAEWIVVSGKCGKTIDGRTVKCPKCGNFLYMGGVNGGRGDANFCPNCGARMKRSEEIDETRT